MLRAAGVQTQRTQRERGKDRSLPADVELLIAVGGDGTVLRAQRMAVPAGIPVLGIAGGRLGFLAEIAPPQLDDAIRRLLTGDYRIEHRGMLNVVHERDGRVHGDHSALNDAVLARGRSPRSLWISVSVDDAHLANYVADGIVAATATGSTAYSLAAGGPILAPELRNVILTPIAAHLSIVQSVILSPESRIELKLVRSQDASLTVDGQVDTTFSLGDRLLITTSDVQARFVRMTPMSQFYTQLVARLQHDLDRTHGPSGTDVEPARA